MVRFSTMLASSTATSELRLRDAGLAHADASAPACTPPATSPASQPSCAQQQHPPIDGEIDQYARNFDCNLCMGECCDPVVTMCGHLFCWSCLYLCLSLNHPSASSECPVCRSDVQDKIVPLYGCGKGSLSSEKCRGRHIPARPSAVTHNHNCLQPNHAIQQNGGSSAQYLALCAFLRRLGLPSLAPDQEGGSLRRHVQDVASRLMRRRRFNNQKEFALHWLFIVAASAAIPFFVLC